jgi:hypothetical protein
MGIGGVVSVNGIKKAVRRKEPREDLGGWLKHGSEELFVCELVIAHVGMLVGRKAGGKCRKVLNSNS